jgi:hypothetical protein
MNKNSYTTLFFAAFFCTTIFAQDSRIWSTYYGGSNNETAVSIVTDAAGNVFMAGTTMSVGMAFNGFQNSYGGGNVDSYLVKFDAAGNRLWATYYGGTGDEMPFFGGKIGLAVDSSGNVYLGGLSNSPNAIASAGSFQSANGGFYDAYVAKFSPTGARLWATYYGGTASDFGYGVAVDKNQNVYLTGSTGSAGLAFNGFQNILNGTGDAFLVKFNPSGNRIWATYYGGPSGDEGYSVTTDSFGNVYLAGSTFSASGISYGGFQNTFGGGQYDAFIVKFDSTGARLWATYYGGTGDEIYPFSGDLEVVCDISDNVYLSGMTSSTSAIASSNAFQTNHGGGTYDVFLVKFNSAGYRLWATYYGGADDDKAYHVATDTAGTVFIAGQTVSTSGIASGGFQNAHGGGTYDAFLVKFNSAGFRLCATYFGGNDYEDANGMVVDYSGDVYICGGTATTAGIGSGGFQNFFGGGQSDAYVAKFTSCSNPLQAEEVVLNNNLTLFPNPSSGKFTVENKHVENGTIEIFDLFGQLVYSLGNFNKVQEIDISGFAKGMYLVKVYDGKTYYTKKIVVE